MEETKLKQEEILHRLTSLESRFKELLEKVLTVKSNVKHVITPTEKKVFEECMALGITSAKLKRTPADYYDWTLEERMNCIQAASIDHLCKSIILENTACTNEDCSDPLNSRFYCVILQYTARLASHKVFKFVRSLKDKSPKKDYHFALAKEEVLFSFSHEKDSLRLSGYEHNAVCPIGTTVPIPLILSHRIAALTPSFFWLGGGETDLKLGIATEEFIDTLSPFVADVTMDS